MPMFRIHHRHAAEECGAVFAAWAGFSSPLRGSVATCSCLYGMHELWWDVDSANEKEALSRLPPFLAERSTVSRVKDHRIP